MTKQESRLFAEWRLETNSVRKDRAIHRAFERQLGKHAEHKKSQFKHDKFWIMVVDNHINKIRLEYSLALVTNSPKK